jgi:hypothetical protein
MSASTGIPEAEDLSVVVVGSFNPSIFHPEWFLRQKLIGDEDAKDAGIQNVSNEATEIKLCGLKLICSQKRLVLRCSNISHAARLQDLLAQMMLLLPHTPVIACGINPNAHYSVGNRDYWHKIGHVLAPKELLWNELVKQPGMKSLTITGVREGAFPGNVNITVEPSAKFVPGLYIGLNHHYVVPEGSRRAGGAECVVGFLKGEWDSACAMPRRVAQMVFEKIKPDNG